VDHTIPPNKSLLRNKSVVVTGGANGMGEELVRQFAACGSYVTYGDINEARGKQVENEILQGGGKAKFILCNTTSWDDQVRMFDAAIANSPNQSCDVVIANAGISRSSGDSLWKLDGKIRRTHSNYSPPDV
jgi:NAD(P)-dependent dehydrogenase (short-subunit alcohol dehydrogenase family)